jgi:hypothetical protein
MLARPLDSPVPLPTCVNYFAKQRPLRRPIGIADWERGADGGLARVTLLADYAEEDRSHWKGDPPYDWIPLAIQRWLTENVHCRWLFEITCEMPNLDGRLMRIVRLHFVFERFADAVLFKLRWVGANNN